VESRNKELPNDTQAELAPVLLDDMWKLTIPLGCGG
jgi:hypothetical protein